MRVITGSLKGRTIPFSARKGSLRVTGSMLKEAVFAMLGPQLQESAFLDLCAGSGQMGFEACSRGASVVFNEPDRRRFGQIKTLARQWRLRNIEMFSAKAQVLLPRLCEQQRAFDAIYLDPPYDATFESRPLSLTLIEKLGASRILAPGGRLYAQVQKSLDLPEEAGELTLQRQRKYGDTLLGIFASRHDAPTPEDA